MKYDVITIGSTTYDSFLGVDFETIDWPKTQSGKAYAVPLGEKVGLKKAYFTNGGNAANASVTFARNGYKAALFTRIGKDAEGEEIKKRLKKERVETKFMTLSETPTARGFLLSQGGERTILSYHGAVDEFSLEDINFGKMKADWIYVSLPGKSWNMFGAIVEAARKAGIKVAINPSGKHIKEGREALLAELKNISLLVLNADEAASLVGIPFEREAEVFKALDDIMPGIAVVTNGAKGVKVSDGKRIYEAGVFKEREIVDRTGAGDAFGSAFVAGLLNTGEKCEKENCDPEKIKYAIRLASANATSVVEYLGATEGILSKTKFETDPRWQEFEIKIREINTI